VSANTSPSLLILFTLMMEAIRSSETSVLPTPTPLYIPGYGFFIVSAEKTSNLIQH
jgi:hypothetical protein